MGYPWYPIRILTLMCVPTTTQKCLPWARSPFIPIGNSRGHLNLFMQDCGLSLVRQLQHSLSRTSSLLKLGCHQLPIGLAASA